MMQKILRWLNYHLLRKNMTEIESRCHSDKVRKISFILTFDSIADMDGVRLSGNGYTLEDGTRAGCLVLRGKGNDTTEYYYEEGELKTCLRYKGYEPSWLELNKLGVRREWFHDFTRYTSNDPEFSNHAIQFRKVYAAVKNNN